MLAGAFSGSVPENYDRYMVPLIFEPYAADMAGRAAALSPKAVLETAAGSGVVTRALAPQLAPDAVYVVTDLNQPMLDHAAARQPADDRINWRQADALALPFADRSFDLVCCQFGVMFFPDRVTGYREARRVLKPGGHFIFNTWDRLEENAFAETAFNALAAIFPDDPPRFMKHTPHGYFDTVQIRRDLAEAGFSGAEIVTLAAESRAPSAQVAATAYCQGTPMRAEIETRAPGQLQQVTDRVAAAMADVFGNGAVVGKIQAHVVVANA